MGKIEAKNLSFEYADGFTAIDNISFSIEDGEFVCIVGHSGCGKSTLLRLISGLSLATSGELLLNGKQIEGPGLDRAVVFQQYSLFPWKTALRNVEFGIRQAHPNLNKTEVEKMAKEALDSVGMLDAADRFPFQLSGGMKQRVAIARALALNSDTLLLDEPFGALDQHRRSQLQTMLLNLWEHSEKRKTVIFVTHDIDEAILLADRIIFMRPGEIVKTIEVGLGRNRDAATLAQDPRFGELRRELLELFALDVDEEDVNEG